MQYLAQKLLALLDHLQVQRLWQRSAGGVPGNGAAQDFGRLIWMSCSVLKASAAQPHTQRDYDLQQAACVLEAPHLAVACKNVRATSPCPLQEHLTSAASRTACAANQACAGKQAQIGSPKHGDAAHLRKPAVATTTGL